MALRFPTLRSRILSQSTGVLHIGAHHGEEAERYHDLNLPVMWVEGDPKMHEVLAERLRLFPAQQSRLGLVGREDVESVDFFVASNAGGSSSIYPLAEHGLTKKQKFTMVGRVQIPMVRLDSLFSAREIGGLSHWVVDVQGAELEVLIGAGDLFAFCHTLEIEVSLREVYLGGVQFSELEKWLNSHGFVSLWDPPPESHWEHLFVRTRPHRQ